LTYGMIICRKFIYLVYCVVRIMLMGSFLGDSWDCLHKVESNEINLWDII
jgi:hypothetical protein